MMGNRVERAKQEHKGTKRAEKVSEGCAQAPEGPFPPSLDKAGCLGVPMLPNGHACHRKSDMA